MLLWSRVGAAFILQNKSTKAFCPLHLLCSFSCMFSPVLALCLSLFHCFFFFCSRTAQSGDSVLLFLQHTALFVSGIHLLYSCKMLNFNMGVLYIGRDVHIFNRCPVPGNQYQNSTVPILVAGCVCLCGNMLICLVMRTQNISILTT